MIKTRALTRSHGAKGVAVIAAFEGQETSAMDLTAIAPVLISNLQGNFDAGRSVIREKDPIKSLGKHSRQPRGQLGRGCMGKIGEDDLFQSSRLFGNGSGNGGLGMAMQSYPPRRNQVDDFTAIGQK